MEKRDLTCIGCPLGCQITVTMENGEVTDVKGNTCPRGDKYAREEVTNPTRVVTSIVKVEGGNLAAVSVKTKDVIPKGKIFDILDEIKPVVVKAPVKIGDVIVPNVAGTGVDVIEQRISRQYKSKLLICRRQRRRILKKKRTYICDSITAG